MNHRATYSPEDNKLRIYPGSRLDDELGEERYKEFRAAGYKWAAKQECFVCPRWTPTAEDWALELAGEIDDEDYSPEERSADRAERFEGYREKRRDEAHGHADDYESGPAVFGHQSRARAERQARRHERHKGRALTQWSKAEYWQARTEGVIRHALYKSSAPVRRSRLLRLEAEQRKQQKILDESKARHAGWQKVAAEQDTEKATRWARVLANAGGFRQYTHPRTGAQASLWSLLNDSADPITGHEAAAMWLEGKSEPGAPGSYSERWRLHYELRTTYEKAMLGEEGGMASEADIEPGGWVRGVRTYGVFEHLAGNAEWWQVVSVCRSPVTKRVTSVRIAGLVGCNGRETPGLVNCNVERLGEDNYRPPTDEEREAFKKDQAAAKAKKKATTPKAPPLINPTDADAERLQATWNAQAEATHNRNKSGEFTPSEVLRMTQAQYSARSKGAYSSFETVEVSEQLRIRRRSSMSRDVAGRVTVFKVRKAHASGVSWGGVNRVIILTDKPQKPLPWDQVEAAADEQPSAEKLRPKMKELAAAISLNWLPESGTPEAKLIDDALYVGWVFVSSMSQFGWTDEGAAVFREWMAEQSSTPKKQAELFEEVA